MVRKRAVKDSQSVDAQLNHLRRAVLQRCYKIKVPSNPPEVLNSGDVWHVRKVAVTSLAGSDGVAVLTAGNMLSGLSGNSSNLPVRIASIKAWAISGASGQYPPTFIQVDFRNEEFCQSITGASSVRDSLLDAGGQGAGCPGVGLAVPESFQLTRSEWTTQTGTVLASAVSLPSGARVMWHIVVNFKF